MYVHRGMLSSEWRCNPLSIYIRTCTTPASIIARAATTPLAKTKCPANKLQPGDIVNANAAAAAASCIVISEACIVFVALAQSSAPREQLFLYLRQEHVLE
jgi:hypothetical protein